MILAASAALALVACTKNDVISNNEMGTPLTFGVYASNAATKAVSATDFGTVTTVSLGNAAKKGFGVFAYYTNNADYTRANVANFMYNQKVIGNGDGSAAATAWTYSPIKYWPNEHGTSAESTGVDKLTFLCYAPWVENLTINGATESTVKDADGAAADEGITAMTGNATASDAVLTFKVPASSLQQIDLLYGVLNAQSVNVDSDNEGTVGNPIENLTKEKTGGKVDIKFKHALAKVAIDIKEVVDAEEGPTSVAPASGSPKVTKVVVKEIKLLGNDLATLGKLNLYTGAWDDVNAVTEFAVTPLDETAYAVSAAPTSYPAIAGVDEDGLDEKINLMLIPAQDSEPKDISKITGVEIIYYVCTEDANLQNSVSVVENHITKDFATAITLSKGKAYGINILLGLTSVKLTATVGDWDEVTPATEVDLPKNED